MGERIVKRAVFLKCIAALLGIKEHAVTRRWDGPLPQREH